MSTETTTVDEAPAHDDHHGPSDMAYVRIAIILAVITAVEVAWSYLPWGEGTWAIELAGLVIMMMVKFVMVAAQFMHLKFDDRLLTQVFYSGLILAVAVYLAALTSMELFGGG